MVQWEKETVIITLSNKQKIRCTPDHVFMLNDGTECRAEDLNGKSVKYYSREESTTDMYVVSIEKGTKEKVYDFTEPETHWGVVENVVVHNCAEYLAGTVYGVNPTTNEPLNKNDYGGACNLGSLFLHNFVKNPFTKNARVDFMKLQRTISTAVRFLDNIIDVNKFPDKIYENYQKSFRTIGLGVTGLADMLVMLNLRYSSPKAVQFVDKLIEFIAYEVYSASIELAKEKGNFPLLDKELFSQSEFLQKHLNSKRNGVWQKEGFVVSWDDVVENIQKHGIRNAKLMSIAPCGTLSLTYGNNCSSGIEPIFSKSYDRKVKIGGQSEEDINIVKMMDYAYHLWSNTTEENVVDEDVFETALSLSVDEHVNMLSAIARHVDMSVSKTINVPSSYSFEDTKNIYMKAWESGIKGCTIFRPNEIRQGILIENTESKEDVSENKEPSVDTATTAEAPVAEVLDSLPRGMVENVPTGLNYRKYKIKSGCGNLYLFVGVDEEEGKIYDCFTNTDGTGGCSVNTQANSRLLSACIRGGIPIEYIIKQLNKSGTCPNYQYQRGKGKKLSKGKSCPSSIGNILADILREFRDYDSEIESEIDVKSKLGTTTQQKKEKEIKQQTSIKRLRKKNETAPTKLKTSDNNSDTMCPECGERIVFEGGCSQCYSCGWSRCS